MSYSPQYPAAPSGEQAVYPTLAPQDPGASYDAMLRAGAQAPRRSGVEVAAIVLAAVSLLLEGVQLFLRTQGVMRNAGPSLVAYILVEFLVDPLIILLVVGLVQGAVRRVNGALAGVVVLAVLRAVLIVLRLAALPGTYTYPYASSDVLAVLACVVATVAGILAVVAAPRLRTPVGAALGAGVAYWLLAASASALISLPLNLTAISSRNFGEQTLEVRMREFLNWAPSFPGSPGLSALGVTRQRADPWDIDYRANLAILRSAESHGARCFCFVNVIGGEQCPARLTRAKTAFARELASSSIPSQTINPPGYFSDMIQILRMARRGRVLVLRRGVRINPIHGADLATFCADRLVSGREGTWDVGGPELFTWQGLAECAFHALGRPATVTTVPSAALTPLTRVVGLVSPRRADALRFAAWSMLHDCVGEPIGTHRLLEFYKRHAADMD